MPKIENRIHKYLLNSRSWYQRPTEKVTTLTIHHSAMKQDGRQTNDSVLETIKKVHTGQGWPGLSYHFVIMPDGTIYQTNDFTDITWHDTINDDSIGILVHGYFHPDVNEIPTQAQLVSLKELLDDLCINHPEFPADQDNVVGHRERSATACPGDNLFKYVVEYREKKGQVNWVQTASKCEDDLAKMTKGYEEWKTKSRDKDKTIKELEKTISDKDKQYEVLKMAMGEMERQRNEAVLSANKYSMELVNTKENLKTAVELNLSLVEENKSLKDNNRDFTLKEIVEICKRYIKKIYESKKLI